MTKPTIADYLHTISLPTPFPVGPVNVYLAEGEPLTLVDAGPRYDPAREALEVALAGHGYRVTGLRRIVLSHAHPDHCGLAAELARVSGAEVLTHVTNLPWLADDASAHSLTFYGEVMRWAGVPVEPLMGLARMQRSTDRYAEPVPPDHTLADGDCALAGRRGLAGAPHPGSRRWPHLPLPTPAPAAHLQ